MPEPRVEPLPHGKAFVCMIPTRGARSFPSSGVPPSRGSDRRVGFTSDFARRSPPHGQYEARMNNRSFEYQWNYGSRFPPRGTRIPPRRRERVPRMSSGKVDYANPSFEQMARHWFDSFCANPSVESFAHSCFRF